MSNLANDFDAAGDLRESEPPPPDSLPLPEDVIGATLQYFGISMFARFVFRVSESRLRRFRGQFSQL
jgi:hypothetical protein